MLTSYSSLGPNPLFQTCFSVLPVTLTMFPIDFHMLETWTSTTKTQCIRLCFHCFPKALGLISPFRAGDDGDVPCCWLTTCPKPMAIGPGKGTPVLDAFAKSESSWGVGSTTLVGNPHWKWRLQWEYNGNILDNLRNIWENPYKWKGL